jgi:sulfur carrier protein
MKIWLNGDEKETTATDVALLVKALKFPEQAVLIEHNGLALRRDEWALRSLNPGDRIEAVRIVAGG